MSRKTQAERDRRKRIYSFRHAPRPSVRPHCPICKFPVYSLGGVHPQCYITEQESKQS